MRRRIPIPIIDKIREDYIRGLGSCRELAEKYNVPTSGVQGRCKREKWRKLSSDKILKTCITCGERYALNKFYRNSRREDGLSTSCKYCDSKHKFDPVSKQIRNLKDKLKGLNITVREYKELLVNQRNRCAICGMTEQENKRPLAIDHDHRSGYVRELLCSCCNTALGMMNDSPKFLRAAADYIEKHEHRFELDNKDPF